jgi:hypothetical protein
VPTAASRDALSVWVERLRFALLVGLVVLALVAMEILGLLVVDALR